MQMFRLFLNNRNLKKKEIKKEEKERKKEKGRETRLT